MPPGRRGRRAVIQVRSLPAVNLGFRVLSSSNVLLPVLVLQLWLAGRLNICMRPNKLAPSRFQPSNSSGVSAGLRTRREQSTRCCTPSGACTLRLRCGPETGRFCWIPSRLDPHYIVLMIGESFYGISVQAGDDHSKLYGLESSCSDVAVKVADGSKALRTREDRAGHKGVELTDMGQP